MYSCLDALSAESPTLEIRELETLLAMGFNLFRFALDAQYRSVKRWKLARGDERLIADFPLSASSVVIDAGFYKGDFARRMSERFGCRVFAFEPAPEFCDLAKPLLETLPDVSLECAGLSDFDGTTRLTYAADGTSTHRKSEGDVVDAKVRAASGVLDEIRTPIDLMKLNIEGDEYPVLENLLDKGKMTSVRHLLVQFHLIDDTSRSRYDAIAARLRETHELVWRYPFVWERWDLKASASVG